MSGPSRTDEHGQLAHASGQLSYVTAVVADQLFGIAIDRIRDVFNVDILTPVPLAPAEVAGLMNLRGRVLTIIDMRTRLGVPAEERAKASVALGVEVAGEPFGLLVDRVGEIERFPADTLEPVPVHIAASWSPMARGIHRMDGGLLVVIDPAAIVASIGVSNVPEHAHA